MGKIRVVHFIHGLNMGGAEMLVKNYALLMDKDKFEVTVLCLEKLNTPYENVLEEAGIPLIYLRDRMALGNKKGLIAKVVNHYEMYFSVRKVLRKLKPDILHVHLELNSYVLFSHLSEKTSIFFTNHHTVARWKENKQDIRAMKKLIRAYPTKIIALTPEMKEEIDSLFGVDNTSVINNGIDLRCYEEKIDRTKKRKELGVPEEAFVIVHIGRFNPIKNHIFLINVFEEIKKKKTDAFLVMVGRGETENEVVTELKKKHLENNAIILHDRTDVPQILMGADAAVFPSLSEGLGISAIEMQAAGLACIVSEAVPESAKVSNKIRFFKLERGPEVWGNELLSMVDGNQPLRYENLEAWDIRQNVKELEQLYEEAVNNGR